MCTFDGCDNLTSVAISHSVTEIGPYAFYWCDSLLSVDFENTSGWLVSTDLTVANGISVDVSDITMNAKHLKSTYNEYYWNRSE